MMLDLSVDEVLSKAVTLTNGVTVLNVTPHPLNFGMPNGEIEVVPISKYVCNADPQEQIVSATGLINLVKTVFMARPDEREFLQSLLASMPKNSVIVGSIIAAQAYPNQVVSGIQLVQDRGVSVGERVYRTNPFKFNSFAV